MKRPDRHSSFTTQSVKSRRSAVDIEALAVAALTFLSSDRERLGDFLAITGLDPAHLRDAAGQPGFMDGILNYLAGDEALLVRFCADQGLNPEAVGHSILEQAARRGEA